MKLKEFIEAENLMEFVKYESLIKAWNRIKIDMYEKIENGYILIQGKNKYRVTTKKYDDGDIVYHGEVNNYGFEKIPCMTSSEEKNYPKSVAWIGTLIADKRRVEGC